MISCSFRILPNNVKVPSHYNRQLQRIDNVVHLIEEADTGTIVPRAHLDPSLFVSINVYYPKQQAFVPLQQRQQHSPVPKFGNWEGEEDVPYTVYFDNVGLILLREKNRKWMDRPSGDSTPSRYGCGLAISSGKAPKRPTRSSIGSENSLEKSPLHHQARGMGRGSMASPAWEGKTSYDSSHDTFRRSRLRPSARDDETPDKSAAASKFGVWMRVIWHQLMAILTFLTRCEKKGTMGVGYQALMVIDPRTTMLGIRSLLTTVLLRYVVWEPH
ncbi:Detected protein of unknown function [Hibiscus syriacus]|uniref:RIN4 pathogenic type III effector avirulence factor Avr cleavage site domain-containing protein n=1 Tax=Hibiscus syriacus TaxID=106335 RepID=A0A6A3A6J4_HIBSY|nr:Detected protein of unknown function [Hibiscus syriacus]